MNKKYHKQLFIGPMTKNVVDSILEFNKNVDDFFGIIPSRRQIESENLGSGYVNNWSTEKFKKYTGDTLVLRDHGGPGQGKEDDDGRKSILYDIESGLNFLHIDPWKKCKSIQDGIDLTIDLIRYSLDLDRNCKFEIGTEEAIYKYTPGELQKIITGVKKGLSSDFNSIVYGVVQSGTKIRGVKNTGVFDYKKSKEMASICKSHGLLVKEHNTDYLTLGEIAERLNSGVDSLNIAPEFGVIETRVLLNELNNHKNLKEDFLNLCYDSKKWVKWVDAEPDKDIIAEICGHYVYGSEEFKNIKSQLPADIDKKIKESVFLKLSQLAKYLKGH